MLQHSAPMPAWLRENWSRLLRFVAITIESQPPELRQAIHDAIDAGDITQVEFAVDDERQVVFFGFAGHALGHATFESLTGIRNSELRH